MCCTLPQQGYSRDFRNVSLRKVGILDLKKCNTRIHLEKQCIYSSQTVAKVNSRLR